MSKLLFFIEKKFTQQEILELPKQAKLLPSRTSLFGPCPDESGLSVNKEQAKNQD
jgi:hypothetical protein